MTLMQATSILVIYPIFVVKAFGVFKYWKGYVDKNVLKFMFKLKKKKSVFTMAFTCAQYSAQLGNRNW